MSNGAEETYYRQPPAFGQPFNDGAEQRRPAFHFPSIDLLTTDGFPETSHRALQLLQGSLGETVELRTIEAEQKDTQETLAPVIQLGTTAEISPPVSRETAPVRRIKNTGIYDVRDEAIELYPFMHFRISRPHMEGKGVIVASDESRLRAMLHALQDGWKDAPKISTPKLMEIHKRIHGLEKVKVNVINSEGHKVETRRGNLHELEPVLQDIYATLARRNHPVMQLLAQAAEEYPDLPQATFDSFRSHLTVGIASDQIREMYLDLVRTRIKALRKTKLPDVYTQPIDQVQ